MSPIHDNIFIPTATDLGARMWYWRWSKNALPERRELSIVRNSDLWDEVALAYETLNKLHPTHGIGFFVENCHDARIQLVWLHNGAAIRVFGVNTWSDFWILNGSKTGGDNDLFMMPEEHEVSPERKLGQDAIRTAVDNWLTRGFFNLTLT